MKKIALIFSAILFSGCSTNNVEKSSDLENLFIKQGYTEYEFSSILDEVEKQEELSFEDSALLFLTSGGYSNQKAIQLINFALERNNHTYSDHDRLLLEIALDYGIIRFRESSQDFKLKSEDIRAITHKSALDDFGSEIYHRWNVIQREGMEYKNRNTEFSFIWNGIDLEDGKPVVKDIYLDIKGKRIIDNFEEYNKDKEVFHP